MKNKIKEICERLNREQASVHGATEELFDLVDVMQRFQDFINEYENKITKEQAIINGLDPIETCDDVLYELKIMRDVLNECYQEVFNCA